MGHKLRGGKSGYFLDILERNQPATGCRSEGRTQEVNQPFKSGVRNEILCVISG